MMRATQSAMARKPKLGALGLGVAVLAGALPLSPAMAQDTSPSQTQPGATAVEPSPASRFSFPPAQGLTAPAGAEAIRFQLSDIAVEGQFPELEATSRDLEAAHAGREVSVSSIYAFASDLQQAYIGAGFPLARVVVPPQELGDNGVVRIVVVDGFVEAVDASQLAEEVRAQVMKVLQPLIGERRPTRAALERRLLIAGDSAGLALSSTLTPGRQTGATVLVLTGDYDSKSAVLAADNRVSSQLGRSQITASVAFNSALGHGERIYVTFAAHPDGGMFSEDSRRRYFALGASLPVGDDGWTVGLTADYSTTHPGDDVAPQMLESSYSRIGASASYPILRSRTANLVGRVGFDAASDTQATKLGGPTTTLSADRIRALRFSLDGDARLSDDRTVTYGVGLSHGLDILGARMASEASVLKPLSRAGADAEFTAIDGNLSLSSPAFFGTNSTFSARGRFGFNEPLLRSEQFSPVGWDEMSGPPPGLLIGDSGAVARIELERPYSLNDGAIAPYAFASATTVKLEQPSILERARTEATGIGVGVRLGAGRRAGGGFDFAGTLELSQVSSDQHDVDRSWISAAFAMRF